MRLYALSDDEEILVGLRLAGIEGEKVRPGETLTARLKELDEDSTVAVIIINRSLALAVSDELLEFKKTSRTLLAEIPDKDGAEVTDTVTQYVKNALGIS